MAPPRRLGREGGADALGTAPLRGFAFQVCEDRVLDGPASVEKGSKGRN